MYLEWIEYMKFQFFEWNFLNIPRIPSAFDLDLFK